jgi:hypothetical protein
MSTSVCSFAADKPETPTLLPAGRPTWLGGAPLPREDEPASSALVLTEAQSLQRWLDLSA